MNITGLKPKISMQGVAYLSEATVFTAPVASPLSPIRTNTRDAKPYDVSRFCTSFGTYAYAQECGVGSLIDVAMYIRLCEQRHTGSGDPYLLINGFDMNGHNLWPVRLWRFEEGDMQTNTTYMIRGLKVVHEKYYCEIQGKYLPKPNGQKTVDGCWRSAIEDVSQVSEITACFDWIGQ